MDRRLSLWMLLFVLILLSSTAFAADHAERNLIINGDFEQIGQDQKPVKWKPDFWQEGSALIVTEEKKHSGRYALMIKSAHENDVRMIQSIRVKPNTCYKLSGWIATENVTMDRTGANLSIMIPGGYNITQSMNGTNDWTYKELNFKTHGRQTEIIVGARLGMWGNVVTGTAYFDDLSLVELKEEPADCQYLSDSGQSSTQNSGTQSGPGFFTRWFISLLVLSVIAFLVIKKWMKRIGEEELK